MKNFFKITFASMFGAILALFVVIGMSVIILMASISSAADDEVTTIEENTLLHIKLKEEIVDRASSNNPINNLGLPGYSSGNKLGLNDILESLEKAKKDENIKGIYLDLSSINAGWASLKEIRDALIDFKESGKFILSYSDIYTHKSYYVASVANYLYLNPEGYFQLVGMSAQVMFFKNALKKLGVEPVIIRHGKFKSAVEPLMLEHMSNSNREQLRTYVGSIWKNVISEISKDREISVEKLNLIADSLLINNAKSCLEYKLVDSLKYKDEIINKLKKLTETKEKDDIKSITLSNYKKVPKTISDDNEGLAKDKIAVIYASGTIVTGNSSNDNMGSETVSKAIRKVRRDKKIKAIVLRVNSPGGSALASEIIWREVVLAAKVKPVIASFGDVAASGGYYIACGADTIVAEPSTITGSIGVFGVLFNMTELLTDKLGINTDVVKTNAHSDIGNMSRKMTDYERNYIQMNVEDIYSTFISHVAEGRNMTIADVDSIGQGRVWSGENAKSIGLVDEFGGLNKAIDIAAKKAKLDKYRVVDYPKQKNSFEKIMEMLETKLEHDIISKKLNSNYKYYKSLEYIIKNQGIQAILPYSISVN